MKASFSAGVSSAYLMSIGTGENAFLFLVGAVLGLMCISRAIQGLNVFMYFFLPYLVSGCLAIGYGFLIQHVAAIWSLSSLSTLLIAICLSGVVFGGVMLMYNYYSNSISKVIDYYDSMMNKEVKH